MDLKDIISSNYLIQPNEISKNEDSTDGNVYIIKSDRKYVLKIYNSEFHANSMVKLHASLISNKFHVPEIIKTKDNEGYLKYEDKVFVIYSFLDGNQISIFKDLSDDIIEGIAKELRKFHDTTPKNEYNLDNLSFGGFDNIRLSALHFDLTKDNIFYFNNKVGFIDFDDAKYGPSVCDVAIIISFLFVSKSKGINKEKIKLFIDKYYGEDIKLKEKEIKLIPKYVNKWVNYLLDGHEFDTSMKESFNVKNKLIGENSDIFI